VLIKELSMSAAATLFREKGHEPPTHEELTDLSTNTLRNHSRREHDRRVEAKRRLKNFNKRGTVTRWRDGQSVSLPKKEKYIKTGGESAADKAKTSVDLYIIGIGRGGRHAVKIARDAKRKGPMSHK